MFEEVMQALTDIMGGKIDTNILPSFLAELINSPLFFYLVGMGIAIVSCVLFYLKYYSDSKYGREGRRF